MAVRFYLDHGLATEDWILVGLGVLALTQIALRSLLFRRDRLAGRAMGSHGGPQLHPVPQDALLIPREGPAAPMSRIESMAIRAIGRHGHAWRVQLFYVVGVSLTFLGLLVWAVVMATLNQARMAAFLGGGSVAGAILTYRLWQPFERMNEARQRADEADFLATAAGQRLETIAKIEDPKEREQREWQAAVDFIDASRATAVDLPRKSSARGSRSGKATLAKRRHPRAAPPNS